MAKEIIVTYKNNGNELVIIDKSKFKDHQSHEVLVHTFIATDNDSFQYKRYSAIADSSSYLDQDKWGLSQPTINVKSPDQFHFEDGILKLGSIPIKDFPFEAAPFVKGFIESKYIFPEDFSGLLTQREQAYFKALKETTELHKKEKTGAKKEVTPLQEFFNNPDLSNVDFSFAPNSYPAFLQIMAKSNKEDPDSSYLRIAFSDPLEIVIQDTSVVDYPNCKRVSIALPRNSFKEIIMESVFPSGYNFRLTTKNRVQNLFSAIEYLKFDMLGRTWEAENEKVLLYLEGLASVINGIYNPRKLIDYLDAVDKSE